LVDGTSESGEPLPSQWQSEAATDVDSE